MAAHALPQALHQHPLAALYEVDPHSIVESKRDTRDIDTGQRHAPDHILRFAADTYGVICSTSDSDFIFQLQ